MTGSIKYEHYRPRLGKLPGTRGKTPDAVLFRYYRGNSEFIPDPKGGKTFCTITLPGGVQYIGEANCSQSDIFCFAEGRAWALKYALEAMLEGEPQSGIFAMPEDGKLHWTMPLEDGRTIARYLKTFLNNTKAFSDTARNELYKALNNVEVFGFHRKD